uniref:Expressed protein n=1 Tax=Schizophyllum commune (strain H4-8 / FGSC 9210) TaxID=578458 RepID=D8PYQ9_SCHCM
MPKLSRSRAHAIEFPFAWSDEGRRDDLEELDTQITHLQLRGHPRKPRAHAETATAGGALERERAPLPSPPPPPRRPPPTPASPPRRAPALRLLAF